MSEIDAVERSRLTTRAAVASIAMAVILIVLGAACLFIINRMAGSKMGGVFG